MLIETVIWKILCVLFVAWVSLLVADAVFDITKPGKAHWVKTVGAFTMLVDVIGWVLYGLYQLFMWV